MRRPVDPAPLGPFRDLSGSVSTDLEEALSVGAASHELHRPLIEELESAPQPTVLALEDVHWADGATLDTIASSVAGSDPCRR